MSGTKNDPAAWRPVDFTTTPADPPTLEAQLWNAVIDWLWNLRVDVTLIRVGIEFRHTSPWSEIEFRHAEYGVLLRASWEGDDAIDRVGSGYYVNKVEIEEVAKP